MDTTENKPPMAHLPEATKVTSTESDDTTTSTKHTHTAIMALTQYPQAKCFLCSQSFSNTTPPSSHYSERHHILCDAAKTDFPQPYKNNRTEESVTPENIHNDSPISNEPKHHPSEQMSPSPTNFDKIDPQPHGSDRNFYRSPTPNQKKHYSYTHEQKLRNEIFKLREENQMYLSELRTQNAIISSKINTYTPLDARPTPSVSDPYSRPPYHLLLKAKSNQILYLTCQINELIDRNSHLTSLTRFRPSEHQNNQALKPWEKWLPWRCTTCREYNSRKRGACTKCQQPATHIPWDSVSCQCGCRFYYKESHCPFCNNWNLPPRFRHI